MTGRYVFRRVVKVVDLGRSSQAHPHGPQKEMGKEASLLPHWPTASSGRGVYGQATSTLISLGLASSFFGSWISSTPSRYVAFTRLESTTEGSKILRSNRP